MRNSGTALVLHLRQVDKLTRQRSELVNRKDVYLLVRVMAKTCNCAGFDRPLAIGSYHRLAILRSYYRSSPTMPVSRNGPCQPVKLQEAARMAGTSCHKLETLHADSERLVNNTATERLGLDNY
jgi:hypothetical protein